MRERKAKIPGSGYKIRRVAPTGILAQLLFAFDQLLQSLANGFTPGLEFCDITRRVSGKQTFCHPIPFEGYVSARLLKL
jgi:hypothetical protein